MLIVEVKEFDPQEGMKIIHYLELESSGDGEVCNVLVKHVSTEGTNRSRPNEAVVPVHRKREGTLKLLRRVFCELCAEPTKREIAPV